MAMSLVHSHAQQVIGHRGAKGYVAENTLPSIKRAFELGADGIEIDVFRIRTGELVVFHDEDLDRLTGQSGLIENCTLEEVRALRVADEYPIPLLEEVLELLPQNKMINIELKGADTAAPTLHMLYGLFDRKMLQPEQVIISSFNWDELQRLRTTEAQQATNYIALRLGVLTEDDPLEALEIAQSLKAFSIHPNFQQLNAENTKTIKWAGFEIYVWTVNSPEAIERMKELQVAGIITDYPDRIFP
ncbi:glycerophosphodiester phosphodiesterase [Croceiramulus getboli]|nr:glycerophosphodiester phosphodiesterase family protein [Flavobacteriaceae bacterium YJPT1-3]